MDVILHVISFLYTALFLGIAAIIIGFSYNLVTASHQPQQQGRQRKFKETDFWDEVDGGTYVTMRDGSVRLDNNGSY